MEAIIKAVSLKNELDNSRPIDAEMEARIMQKFRLDWNYHSNHLEGNSLSYGETKALLMFGITAQGKPLKDHFEITGHNEGINYALDMIKGNRPLTENFIREIHQLLLKERYQVDAISPDGLPTKRWIEVGKYKTNPNHVVTKTGEIFYFASPEETPAKMTELLDWYNTKCKIETPNPILIAAEFHYKFIIIHPFDDGNGRTARIIMNFILMQFGYPPVIIKTEDKANYFAVLQLADAGNIEAFIEYIAVNLNRSLEIMIAGANGDDIEEDDDLDKEIALLEQKLDFLNRNAPEIKSREHIKKLFENSIFRVEKKLTQKLKSFENLYNQLTFSVIIDNLPYVSINEAFQSLDIVDSNIKSITIMSYFKILKIKSVDEFDYKNNLKFGFYSSSYIIVDSDSKKLLQKPYGTQLTEVEINKIVNSEVKRHKDFIEQKIAEKEAKTN
jgi:Fic family protein